MKIMMMSKCLYRVTMETKDEPNAKAENIKWHNRRDEAYSILCLGISRDLIFHLDGLISPNEVWEKIQNLFRKIYEMMGHKLENDLISLCPENFESLQVYFSKFKALVLQLKKCGIENKYEKIFLAIVFEAWP